jgi:hypothetical protein
MPQPATPGAVIVLSRARGNGLAPALRATKRMKYLTLAACLAGGFFMQGCTIRTYPTYAAATPAAYVAADSYAPPPVIEPAPVVVHAPPVVVHRPPVVVIHREHRHYRRDRPYPRHQAPQRHHHHGRPHVVVR